MRNSKQQELKEIIREVIKEEIVKVPLILAARAPTSNDLHEIGTTWLHGNDKYVVKEVKVTWEKL